MATSGHILAHMEFSGALEKELTELAVSLGIVETDTDFEALVAAFSK